MSSMYLCPPWFEAMKISDVSGTFRGLIRSFEDRAYMSVATAAQINRISDVRFGQSLKVHLRCCADTLDRCTAT